MKCETCITGKQCKKILLTTHTLNMMVVFALKINFNLVFKCVVNSSAFCQKDIIMESKNTQHQLCVGSIFYNSASKFITQHKTNKC